MPNLFAHLVLYASPVVVLILFLTLERNKAIIVSIVGGYLFLPVQVELDLPLLPVIDKSLLPALTAMIMCLLLKETNAQTSISADPLLRKSMASHRRSVHVIILISLLLLLIVALFGMVLTNQESVYFGVGYLPPMRFYDSFSILLLTFVALLPFFLGWWYLPTSKDHRILLLFLASAGLIYSLPALFEVRMSPQLNVWIYGFFPHSFDQHLRGSGFRPLVFLPHGLWLGMFFAMTTLAVSAMLRRSKFAASNSLVWSLALTFTLITLVLVKSLGALIITLVLVPFILFGSSRTMMRVSTIIAFVVLFYPMLRGLDWIPVEQISNFAESINPQRAASFNTRLESEDLLLDRATEKPFFGWGGYGRNSVFDFQTGREIAILDGQWVEFIGSYGWLGYIARFGLLTFPLFFWMAKGLPRPIPLATGGLSLVLAANLIDLIPNATLTPVTWLIAGSLAGYITNRQTEAAESPEDEPAISYSPPSDHPKNIRIPRG